MTPEEKARRIIDEKLCQAGWVIQDMNRLNLVRRRRSFYRAWRL